MRIAIVTETYPPEVNGVALTVQGLELGLRALGHEVSVVRPTQPDAASAPTTDMLVPGAALPRYPGLRFGFPAGKRLRSRWMQQRPDAVYIATEGPLGWSAVRAARRLGIPAATGFHTRFDSYVGRYGMGFLAPLTMAWLRRFHNQAQATVVPTMELAEFLRGRGFAQVEVLERAVDTRLFDPSRRDLRLRESWGLRSDQLAVIYLGRIAPEKNLELAVRAFRAIQLQQPDARFVFVGDGPARARLETANPDFIFTGVQRGVALARHFASGDLFLFPSLSETFGNVTLEAMASGVPWVAYNYGAVHQHARDGVHGACIALGDEQGFVAAARELAVDAARRARYAVAARERVAALDPASVHRRFAGLLSRLALDCRVRVAAR